ncbi:MAG: trypsin-like peptidase domain-containing protein [Candidatus Neomarinimicrobiota bacterium]|nr:trypsin-like peptidase domain-containing protein [Candidatus Neomarinimicrobiota bacterium]
MNKITTLMLSTFIILAQPQSVEVSRQNALTNSISIASPGVASINVTQIQRFSVNPWFEQFQRDPVFSQLFPSELNMREVKSSGSGVVISPDGYVVTNDHVVENASKIIVTLPGGNEYEAEVIGVDQLTDLALLKLDGDNFPYMKIGDSDKLIIGEWVIALGNPFGLFDVNQQPTATIGIVSGKNMDFGQQGSHVFQDMIQTDAAINPGNSGGPLVNVKGEVIGINTFIYTGNRNRQGSIGIGFAIPINRALSIVKELRSKGRIVRGFNLGFRGQSLDSRTAKLWQMNSNQGVIIAQIAPNSPADKAKLQYMDVILSVENQNVSSSKDIYEIIAVLDLRPGDRISLKVWREGRIINRYLILDSF